MVVVLGEEPALAFELPGATGVVPRAKNDLMRLFAYGWAVMRASWPSMTCEYVGRTLVMRLDSLSEWYLSPSEISSPPPKDESTVRSDTVAPRNEFNSKTFGRHRGPC